MLKDGHQIALADFVWNTSNKEAVDHTRNNGIVVEDGETIPTYTVEEVVASFKANPKKTFEN